MTQKRYTPTEENQIKKLILTGKYTRQEIAQKTGANKTKISNIAKQIGHTFPTKSARTQSSLLSARKARSAYTAERRAETAHMAQVRVEEILEEFFKPRPVVVNTRDGVQQVYPEMVDSKNIKELAQAVLALQKTVSEVLRNDGRASNEGSDLDKFLDYITGADSRDIPDTSNSDDEGADD